MFFAFKIILSVLNAIIAFASGAAAIDEKTNSKVFALAIFFVAVMIVNIFVFWA